MKKPPKPNERLRQARQEQGWTQRHLAQKLEVGEQTVRSWELGIRFPSLELRRRLCVMFSKTPEELGLQLPEENEATSEQLLLPMILPMAPLNPVPQEELGSTSSMVPSLQEPASSLILHQADPHRQRMFLHVRSRWITGVLEHSLYRATLMMLGLQEQPDAVENPWRLAMTEADLSSHPFPEGTPITQVYDESDGQVLILGEPGAGKTTLLLELARDLLDRAEADQSHPIPVILDLSSWTMKRLSLAEWITQELESTYGVPRTTGQAWMKTNQLLLLLDSLDEVAETARAACIEAINAYRQAHEFVPLVVCCRREEYATGSTRIALQQAVVVQPLTPEQIDAYLCSAGGQLEAVRRALEEDPQMREMVTTPLMLNIVTLVYQGKANAPFPIASSLEARRERVFAMYVKRMLARRGAKTRYSDEQTMHWLAWLARQFVQQNQTAFSLEQMQPDWLSNGRLRWLYRHVITWLLYGLIFCVGTAIFAWLGGETLTSFGGDVAKGMLGWISGGPSGPGNAILGWMAPGLGGGLFGGTTIAIVYAVVTLFVFVVLCRADSDPLGGAERNRIPFWQAILSGLKNGVVLGGIGGLVVGLLGQIILGWADGLISGLTCGVVGGLLVGLISGVASALEGQQVHLIADRSSRSTLLQRIGRSISKAFFLQWMDRIIIGLVAGLGFGVVSSLLVGIKSGIVSGLVDGVMTFTLLGWGAIPGFGGRTGGGLIAGLGVQIKPVEVVPWSWTSMAQGLIKNLKDGAAIGLVAMSSIGVTFMLMSGWFYGIRYAVVFGLAFGLIVGVIAGLVILLFGGLEGWFRARPGEHLPVQPHQGRRHAFFQSLLAGIIGGISSGIISGLMSGLIFLLIGRLSWAPALGGAYGLVFGMIFAVLFWLSGGGRAWMEQTVLRLLLWCAGSIPLDYPAFLDFATERILLRKVDGTYRFVHRLLLEYFASFEPEHRSTSHKRSQ